MKDGKVVLVTGGAGFIGSHTVVELIAAGYFPVIVDDLANSKIEVLNRIREITGVLPAFRYLDVRDEEALDAVFSEYEVDYVIHFAGLKAVGESIEKPELYFANNVGSTRTLLKVMERHGVRKIVFSSSATVYGDPKHVPLLESDPVGNVRNPYAATKLESEKLLLEYQKGHPDSAVALLRYFNPVGAHPSGLIGEDPEGIPNNLMPYVCQVAVGKLPVLRIFGNDYDTPDGTGIRDYIHVVDLARAHVLTLKKIDEGPGAYIYNVGTGSGTSVLELVKAFERASGRRIIYEFAPRRPGDAAVSFAGVARAGKELGFKARFGLAEMCRDAWRWQSRNPDGYDTRRRRSMREKLTFKTKWGEELLGWSWTVQKAEGKVILVTGMEECAIRYDDFANFLNEHGYDVYCVDHYGQGLNAGKKPGTVPVGFFDKTLENIDALVEKYRAPGLPVYLFGHSMGSFMVQGYIQRYSDHVKKAVICGSNGPRRRAKLWVGYQLAKILVNERNRDEKGKTFDKMAFGGFNKAIKNPRTNFDWLSYNEKNVDKYIADPLCGYGSSNGFYKELLKGSSKLYGKKGIAKIRKDLPLLIISGAEDPVGDNGKGVESLKNMYLKAGLTDVHMILYPKMRHEVLNELNHGIVYQDVLAFFSK